MSNTYFDTGQMERPRSHGRMTVFAAMTASTFLACSAAPTPLYQHYQAAFGMMPGVLTVIFAVYAISLLIALLTVGSLSDFVGRRPVIFAALLLNAGGLIAFMVANSALTLGAARIIQGFATGMATTALGATVMDTDRKFGPVINSVTAFVGLFFGALLSGALVTFAPLPTELVYIVLLTLTLCEAVLIWGMPETVRKKPGAWASLRPIIRLPAKVRIRFAHISPVNMAGWALGGLNFSLIPSVVRLITHSASPIIGAVVVAILMAGAALAVFGLRARPADQVLLIGAAFLAIGMAVTLDAIATQSTATLFVGIPIAGFGFGAAFSGAMREILPMAEAHERAGLLSTIYVESYLAFSMPVIIAGLAVPGLGLSATTEIYGITLIVLALVSAIAVLITRKGRAP